MLAAGRRNAFAGNNGCLNTRFDSGLRARSPVYHLHAADQLALEFALRPDFRPTRPARFR